MTDRQKTLENAFGSIENFVITGEKYIRAMGVYGNAVDDLVSEYCTAGLDAAGRVDTDKTAMEIRAFINSRAKGAVKDYLRVVTQSRSKVKVNVLSLDARLDDSKKSLHDTTESTRFDTPDTAALKNEEQARFAAALETIPAGQREILEAIVSGKTMVEIAKERGVSKQAISKMQFAAIESMKLAVA